MSYTVSAATAGAVIASISTPVPRPSRRWRGRAPARVALGRDLHDEVRDRDRVAQRNEDPTSFLAAMTPAISATVNTSPLLIWPSD